LLFLSQFKILINVIEIGLVKWLRW